MHVQRHVVDVTTATGGTTTGYTEPVTGRLAAIIYTRDGSNAFASTADFTVTTERDAQAVWNGSNINASASVRPVRAGTATASGVASTLTEVPFYLANDRVKIGIAQGGNTKAGRFSVIII